MVKVTNAYMYYFFLYIFVIINKKSLWLSGRNVVGAQCVRIRIRFQTKFFLLECESQVSGASRLKVTELLNQFGNHICCGKAGSTETIMVLLVCPRDGHRTQNDREIESPKNRKLKTSSKWEGEIERRHSVITEMNLNALLYSSEDSCSLAFHILFVPEGEG